MMHVSLSAMMHDYPQILIQIIFTSNNNIHEAPNKLPVNIGK